jgi:hypothetical protein
LEGATHDRPTYVITDRPGAQLDNRPVADRIIDHHAAIRIARMIQAHVRAGRGRKEDDMLVMEAMLRLIDHPDTADDYYSFRRVLHGHAYSTMQDVIRAAEAELQAEAEERRGARLM